MRGTCRIGNQVKPEQFIWIKCLDRSMCSFQVVDFGNEVDFSVDDFECRGNQVKCRWKFKKDASQRSEWWFHAELSCVFIFGPNFDVRVSSPSARCLAFKQAGERGSSFEKLVVCVACWSKLYIGAPLMHSSGCRCTTSCEGTPVERGWLGGKNKRRISLTCIECPARNFHSRNIPD